MPKLTVLQRATIVVLTKNGLSQRQIADQVGCLKTAVKKTQDKYQATNSITDMARSGRPRVTTERTDRHIVQQVQVNNCHKGRARSGYISVCRCSTLFLRAQLYTQGISFHYLHQLCPPCHCSTDVDMSLSLY